MAQDIYVIDDDESSIPIFKELFRNDKEFKFIGVKTEQIDITLKNIPFLIIINEDSIDRDITGLCKQIRTDEDNQITPIIVVSSNTDKYHKLEVLEQSVEYYIKKPVDTEYLYYTIKNLDRLLKMNRRISPLTGLPGNVQIHAELKKRITNKEEFSVLYLDLDNFKAYNDVYGFLNGDEIIKFTARCVANHLHDTEDESNFVGHIGGDDFVAITANTNCEKICQDIILEFDQGVLKYFNKSDIEKGYLEIPNRKCVIEQFPLTSISIAVVVVDKGRFKNVLEIGESAAQVKHLAKMTPGSTYVIDRRKNI